MANINIYLKKNYRSIEMNNCKYVKKLIFYQKNNFEAKKESFCLYNSNFLFNQRNLMK